MYARMLLNSSTVANRNNKIMRLVFDAECKENCWANR